MAQLLRWCPEPIHPEPHTFVADVDAALLEKVFGNPKREREANIHQYAELNDLRRGFEVEERVLGQIRRLITRIGHLKIVFADNTASSPVSLRIPVLPIADSYRYQ